MRRQLHSLASLFLLPVLACVLNAAGEAVALATPVPSLTEVPLHVEALEDWHRAGFTPGCIQLFDTKAPSFRKGDVLTYQVTALEADGAQRQWLVGLFANPGETKSTNEIPGQHYYCSTGREVNLPGGKSEALAIRIAGPSLRHATEMRRSFKDIWSGAEVGGDYMRQGLAGLPREFLRISQQAADEQSRGLSAPRHPLGVGTSPFSPELLAQGRVMRDHFAITEEEDRAHAMFLPAVNSFFGVMANTLGVRDLFFEVVKLPKWKFLMHGGRLSQVEVDFILTNEVWPSEQWGLPPGGEVNGIAFRVRLYGEPAVLVHLAVTDPKPPLYLGAGIVAFSAVRPDGKGTVVNVRLVSAAGPASN